jgi:hypothetical protein
VKTSDAATELAKRAWQTILFPHDHRSGPNASLATGAAMRLLGRSQITGESRTGSDADREAEVAELREAQVDLQLSRTLEAAGGGGEHLTYFTQKRDGFIYKATWREQFGFVPGLDARGRLRLLKATPSHYLLRCGLANAVFGDDIQLYAIAQDQAGDSSVSSIVTSQPFVIGTPAVEKEIASYLKKLGFEPLTTAAHRPSGLHDVWCRRRDSLVVCDAVSGNFVRTPKGDIVPIDLPAAILPSF